MQEYFQENILIWNKKEKNINISNDNIVSFEQLTYFCAYKHLECISCRNIIG